MKCIDNLKATAAKIGVTLDEQSIDYTIILDAPSGYVWRSSGTRALAEHAANNSQTWYAQAVKEMLIRVSMGLEKVTDPKEIEEHRFELDDDTWGANAEAPERIEWPK